MRELTNNEISVLSEQGCCAEDWTDILVDDDFRTDTVSDVSFHGHVEIGSLCGTLEVEEGFRRRCQIRRATLRNVIIGDDCVIENVRGYISGYNIGDRCYISDVGVMTCQEGSSFGCGTVISVLNEGGKGNVTLCEELTAQVAWLMVNGISVAAPSAAMSDEDDNEVTYGAIGRDSRIVGVREMSNVRVGTGCEIHGASRLDNCTVMSTEDAGTYIGSDVIAESSVIAPGASVTDGAKVMQCFVGESVHVGKGFSAESCVFFANSHMDNGEACACFCGPFSTSHHKSTLLIGGAFSFYNAGSNTNQSNHAYKMGPIHWGTLDRGSKTASGCHILWPSHVGAFSMVMGKVQTHPVTYKMPFSYLIAEDRKTWLVPGVNIKTVGTWRDVGKWVKRDLRPLSTRGDVINLSFPNPYLVQCCLEGLDILTEMVREERDVYEYGSCLIRRESALRGITYYGLVARLFLDVCFRDGADMTREADGGAWFDMCGMLAPASEVERLAYDIRKGDVDSVAELREALRRIDSKFREYRDAYAVSVMRRLDGTDQPDMTRWQAEAQKARETWLDMVRADARKEFEMGDVDEQTLNDCLAAIR